MYVLSLRIVNGFLFLLLNFKRLCLEYMYIYNFYKVLILFYYKLVVLSCMLFRFV